jgi:hypothetical protein
MIRLGYAAINTQLPSPKSGFRNGFECGG